MKLRPAPVLLLVVALALLLVALTFPQWSLAAYPVLAEPAHPPTEDPDVDDDRFAQHYDLDELPPEDRALVERAIEREESITVYAPHGSHHDEHDALPWILEDRWLDSNTLGVYVTVEGEIHAVGASVPGEPFHFVPAVGGGLLVGAGLLPIGGLALLCRWDRRRIGNAVLGGGVVLGLLVLGGLLWLGNAQGHVLGW